MLGETRLGKFSFHVRRVFVACALVPCLVAAGNYSFDWGLVGRFDRWFLAVSFTVLFLVLRYLGPTEQQIRDYRNNQGAKSD